MDHWSRATDLIPENRKGNTIQTSINVSPQENDNLDPERTNNMEETSAPTEASH
jgi:hypothetical protein